MLPPVVFLLLQTQLPALPSGNVDPTGLEGFIKGAVRLGTDDPAQPNYIPRCDMMVRPEVTVDSVRKSLGDVEPHESPEVRFRFTREGGDPLRVTLDGDLPAHLDAELADESVAPELRIRFRPRRLKPGTTAGLEVQCSNMDELLQVPLRFLDPRNSPPKTMPSPAPVNEGHHH